MFKLLSKFNFFHDFFSNWYVTSLELKLNFMHLFSSIFRLSLQSSCVSFSRLIRFPSPVIIPLNAFRGWYDFPLRNVEFCAVVFIDIFVPKKLLFPSFIRICWTSRNGSVEFLIFIEIVLDVIWGPYFSNPSFRFLMISSKISLFFAIKLISSMNRLSSIVFKI